MCLRFWICILCIASVVFGQAQPNGQVPVVSPVTPNEAALFKVDERPLGSYTGTIPISIPLYTLKCGGLQVPVSCNYHMGGIKADEIASNVGLGWSLQAGGSITRIMHGIPDDEMSPGTGFLYTTLKPSDFLNDYNGAEAALVLGNYLDMEPDMYCYNFNGESGQFYFDETGNVVMKQSTALKINPVFTNYQIVGWVIIDDKGNNFYFGTNKNKTVQYHDYAAMTYASTSNTPNMPGYIPFFTTWHLAEIDDMNGENQVLFSYKMTTTQYTTNSGAYGPTGFINSLLCTTEDLYTDNVLMTNQVQEMYLTSIRTRSDSISFNTSNNTRTDMLGGARLDSLNIMDSLGILKKVYHFNYDYFYTTGAPHSPSPYYQRLKLLNITSFGPIRTDSIPTSFTYQESVNLPMHGTFGTDYWGFYNGEDGNATLLPNLIYTADGFNIYTTGMAHREANPTYGVANSLTRITYPTGGYRQFTYEGNQALLPANDQIQPDPAYTASRSFTGTASYQGASFPASSQSFTVNSADGTSVFSFLITGHVANGGTYYASLYLVTTAGSTLVQTFNNTLSGTLPLSNGNYRLDAYMSISGTFSGVQGNWKESTLGSTAIGRFSLSVLTNNRTIGGLRIKQIDDFDPVSGNTYTTRYFYKLYSTDSTLTSGLLVSPVVVASPSGPCGGRGGCVYQRLVANSAYPLASSGGQYVYYTEVRTLQDGNGWTDRSYNYRVDGDSWNYFITQEPLGIPADFSYNRGQLLMESKFNSAGGLLKRTITSYQTLWYQSGQAFKMKGYYHEGSTGLCADGVLCHYCNTPYIINTGYCVPVSTSDSIFGSGGAEVLQTTFSYAGNYGYPSLMQVNKYINNNQVKTTNYRYAFNNLSDFTLPVSLADQGMKNLLQGLNYCQPLEITTTLTPSGGNSSFVEGTRYSFSESVGTGYVHLNRVTQFKTLSDSIIQYYTNYDINGNLTEGYKTADAHTVWLWGYWHSQPVAKITGSTYSTAFSLVNDSVLQHPVSDLALRNEINKIRTALSASGVQVTTYTYNPGIGMTSQTDPAGTTLYYEYDTHGRLMLARDMNNNIVKKFDYHYQGQ